MSGFRVYEAHELGEDGYPFEWHRVLKHQVREEAGHRCIRCGHPYRVGAHESGEWTPCDEKCCHGSPVSIHAGGMEIVAPEALVWPSDVARHIAHGDGVEARWRILTVHHLNRDKADCRWWNLAALCQRCHLTIQGKVYLEREWVREHSDWFKPYAAAWYALRYLGEDLSREETMTRLDELLDLEFRQPSLFAAPGLRTEP